MYDRIGARQDSQAFYEDPATELLRTEAEFEFARSVLEFGCGTGRFAETLLAHHLPDDACYLALDQSPVMVDLAQRRLARFTDRADVQRTQGHIAFDVPDASIDRVVSNYVLDLLSDADVVRFLAEARRVLRPGGLLCVTGLAPGTTGPSRAFTWLWSTVHRLAPSVVGGCRPIEVGDYLEPATWTLRCDRVVVARGLVPSGVLVAAPKARDA